ncbi:MAG: glycosyltransferase family 4 protein [Pirellulales bacterium]|nr:glycosyltransferase family 4 protein [Pirellulales bacterium]
MTTLTAKVAAELADKCETTLVNWSAGRDVRGLRWKTVRWRGVLRTVRALLCGGRVKDADFYYAVSSGSGLLYDMLLVGLAKALGYRPVLHHHVYYYIDRFDWRAKRLFRIAGSEAIHVVHCPLMAEDLRRRYPACRQCLTLSPNIACEIIPSNAPRQPRPFTIGFLSNLTRDKGLDDVAETFARLVAVAPQARLVLAGPCSTADARKLVNRALNRWPENAEYRGPVYGDAKDEFFRNIDAFVYPTRSDSWGIVVSEALASGAPVVVRSRGCLPYIVQGNCGVVIDKDDDFAIAAANILARWSREPDVFNEAVDAARRRSAELHAEATDEIKSFAARLQNLA